MSGPRTTHLTPAKQKELETRKRLGPRLGHAAKGARRAANFYGASARIGGRRFGMTRGHPTQDSPA